MKHRLIIKILIMLVCVNALAGKDRDCESFEYRVDRELCEQKRRAIEQEQEEIERRAETNREQKMQEQQEKLNRVKKYRSIVNTLLGSTSSVSDLESPVEINVDPSLNLESCERLEQEKSFISLYRNHKIGSIAGALTLEDYRTILLNVILLPQSNGELFNDGSEEKSLLKQ